MNLYKRLVRYVKTKYNVNPEEIWMKHPDYHVFRHVDNNKWFAIVIITPDNQQVVGVKIADHLLRDLLVQQEGYDVCYHMPSMTWVSMVLDGSVPFLDICQWVDSSYFATASKETFYRMRSSKSWLLPSNPKFFNLIDAFDYETELTWTSSRGMKAGDIVYMYVSAPVSSVMFACKVIETDIPFTVFKDNNPVIIKIMRFKLLYKYDEGCFSFERLKTQYGVTAIRGPRGIPRALEKDLEQYWK